MKKIKDLLRCSMLNEKLEKLVPEDRNRIYEVIDTLVKQSKQILP